MKPAKVDVALIPLTLINVANVDEELTVRLFVIVSDPPIVELPVLLIYVAFNPARVDVAEFAVRIPEIVVEPVTARFPEIEAEPPTVRFPVSLIYIVLMPANVEVPVFCVRDPRMVVDAPMVVEVEVMEKYVDVAPALVTLKRSAICPFAERMTSGIELTGVPAVDVASMVKTALVKGEDVPMVNWVFALSMVKRLAEEMELAVL
jgi:hypothetical protein